METIINAAIWILIIEIFSFSIFPALSLHFKGLADRGFAMSKFVGILIAAYLVWITGSLHLIAFSRVSVIAFSILTIGIFLIVSIVHLRIEEHLMQRMKHENAPDNHLVAFMKRNPILLKWYEHIVKKSEYTTSKENHTVNIYIVIEEIVFLAGFAAWVYLRGINPMIMGTEKFMDFGILNALLKSSYFPPHDMWLSGYSLNYYYYGQYLFAFLTKLSGIASSYTYNFSIATIFALTFVLACSFVTTLSQKIYAGILSACILTLGGNLNFALTWLQYLFQHGNLNGFSFWYPTSTRLIPYTINEFPVYSFVVSDLHAHVTDIPVVLISLLTSLHIFKQKRLDLIDAALSALLIGSIAVTNSWDAVIYASVLFIAVLFSYLISSDMHATLSDTTLKEKFGIVKQKINETTFDSLFSFLDIPFFQAIVHAGMIAVIGIILFIPFYISFKPPVDGIGLNVIAHSDPRLVIVLFGFFFFFVLSYIVFLIYTALTKKAFHGSDVFAIYMITLGLILLILPEIFYLKDIFYKANPPYFRANTVFKLYYEAWILFALVTGYVIARINSTFHLKDILKRTILVLGVWNLVALLFLAGIFAYTYQAINEGYLNINPKSPTEINQTCIANICTAPFTTDDGTVYIQQQYPDDYAMLTWLNSHANPNSVLAEAVGDSYTYYARISANTGLAAVLGWPNHEYQWRNTYVYSSERITDMFNLYNADSVTQAQEIIQKYGIDYIIVGGQELLKYPDINEPVLKQTGSIVFTSGTSYIIRTSNP